VAEITLVGGEVYLRVDWLTIVAAIRRRGMDCTMVTGGRGLTAERARAAKDA
jgi:MoaA/NifB/PqqE/SkfB family radical SAM enzyme